MAILFSSFEINPQDTGYVVQRDHHDDGTIVEQLVPANEPTTPASVSNFAAIVQKLLNARAGVNATYLGLTNPNNAQNAAQIQALTREVNALIYLLLHELTGLNSTSGA